MQTEAQQREELFLDLYKDLVLHQTTLTPTECKKRALDAVDALFEANKEYYICSHHNTCNTNAWCKHKYPHTDRKWNCGAYDPKEVKMVGYGAGERGGKK